MEPSKTIKGRQKQKPLILKKEILKKEEILPETEKIITGSRVSYSLKNPKKNQAKKVYARPNGARY